MNRIGFNLRIENLVICDLRFGALRNFGQRGLLKKRVLLERGRGVADPNIVKRYGSESISEVFKKFGIFLNKHFYSKTA